MVAACRWSQIRVLMRPQSARHHAVHCPQVEEHIQSSGEWPQTFQRSFISFQEEEVLEGALVDLSRFFSPLIDDKPGCCSSLTPLPLTQLYYLPRFLPLTSADSQAWLKSERLALNQTMPLPDVQPQETPSTTLKPRFCFLYHADHLEERLNSSYFGKVLAQSLNHYWLFFFFNNNALTEKEKLPSHTVLFISLFGWMASRLPALNYGFHWCHVC